MTKPLGKPLPRMSPMTRGFWEGCRNREIRIQRCLRCATFRFPPQMMCRSCHSLDSEWTTVPGSGTIYSYTVPTNQSPGEMPARGFDYPYVIALIELDDAGGARIASNIVDCDLDALRIGLRVEPYFVDINDEISLPLYRIAQDA